MQASRWDDKAHLDSQPIETGVPAIRFHGLRHTSVTLLLSANVPVMVVSQRVGHARASMTLDVYGHAMPDQQQGAADRMSEALYG